MFLLVVCLCLGSLMANVKSQENYEVIQGKIVFNGKEIVDKNEYIEIFMLKPYSIEAIVENYEEEILYYNIYKSKKDLENSNKWLNFSGKIDLAFGDLESLGKLLEHPITAVAKSGKELYIGALKLYTNKLQSGKFVVDTRVNSEIGIINGFTDEGRAASISKGNWEITTFTLLKEEVYEIYAQAYSGIGNIKIANTSLYLNDTKIQSPSVINGSTYIIKHKFDLEGFYAITATLENGEEFLLSYFEVKLQERKHIQVDLYLQVKKDGQIINNIKVPNEGLVYEVARGTSITLSPMFEGQINELKTIKNGEIMDGWYGYFEFYNEIDESKLGTYSFYALDKKNYMTVPNVTLIAPPKPYFDYISIITKNGELKQTGYFTYTIEEDVSEQTYLVAHGTGRNPIYLWYKDGESFYAGNATISLRNVEASNGRYHCDIWDDNYRVSSFFIDMKFISSTTLPKPQIHGIHLESSDLNITVNSDYYHEISKGESLFLTINVSGSNLRYQWYKDGFPLNGEIGIKLLIHTENQVESSGRYTCMVKDDNYEIMSFPIDINAMSTNNETIEQSKIRITQNKKEITIYEGESKILYVYNISGQLVIQKKLHSDMEYISLPAGIYFLKIDNETHKVVL